MTVRRHAKALRTMAGETRRRPRSKAEFIIVVEREEVE